MTSNLQKYFLAMRSVKLLTEQCHHTRHWNDAGPVNIFASFHDCADFCTKYDLGQATFTFGHCDANGVNCHCYCVRDVGSPRFCYEDTFQLQRAGKRLVSIICMNNN